MSDDRVLYVKDDECRRLQPVRHPSARGRIASRMEAMTPGTVDPRTGRVVEGIIATGQPPCPTIRALLRGIKFPLPKEQPDASTMPSRAAFFFGGLFESGWQPSALFWFAGKKTLYSTPELADIYSLPSQLVARLFPMIFLA